MTTQEQIAIMQAYVDGKEIEFCDGTKNWQSTSAPAWDWCLFDYRVKPEPKEPTYRPYANFDEFRADWEKHGGWTIDTRNCEYIFGYAYTEKTSEFILEYKRWADNGTPCGIKED